MRKATPIGVEAATTWLPHGRSRAADAVASGALRARQAHDVDHDEVPAAGADDAPPDMAVRAATAALDGAGVVGADLHVVGHAWMYYQGHDLWSPAHYVARRLAALDAFPVGIQQVCNGGCAAVELVAARLAVDGPDVRWGLVTTADRFSGPGFDRWGSDYGVAYGDGGTALVLRSPAGPRSRLVLRSIATVAAPELEGMHRGRDEFAAAPRVRRERVDMRVTKRAFLAEHGNDLFGRVNVRSIRTVVCRALEEAGLRGDDPRLRRVVLPRFGRRTLEESWVPPLRELLDADLVDPGRATGHLGAGDAAAGLAALLAADAPPEYALAPGEAALVLSAGAGFTWSALLVQVPEN